MSVDSTTTITFRNRIKALPMLKLLFDMGWEPKSHLSDQQVFWYSPKDGVESITKLYTSVSLSELPSILQKIDEADENLSYQESCGMQLVIKKDDGQFTGGFFYFYYNSAEPKVIVGWDYNRILLNNYKGTTDFDFYLKKLEPFFAVYKGDILDIQNADIWE